MELTSRQVRELLGIPQQTLTQWVDLGAIRPIGNAKGSGNHRRFDLLPDVLAVAVGRGMRANGMTLEAAGNAMQALLNMGESKIVDAMEEGRRLMVMVGTQPADVLLSVAAVRKRKQVPYSQSMGAPVTCVDVGFVYKKLMSDVENMRAEPADQNRSEKKPEPVSVAI